MSSTSVNITPVTGFPVMTEDDTTVSVTFRVLDENGNPPPSGTTIALTPPAGVSILGDSSYIVLSTNNAAPAANQYSFTLKTANNTFVDDNMVLKVTAPSNCGTKITTSGFRIRSDTQCTDGDNNDPLTPGGPPFQVSGNNFDGTTIDKGDDVTDDKDNGCRDTGGEYNPNDDNEFSACQDGVNNDAAEGTDAEDPDCHKLIKQDLNMDGDFADPGETTIGDFDPQINEEAASI
jgi:hypothetical protein